ncbi:hypothetical protein IWX48DRAFT_72245 [Phyllosticta citricarpa]
MAMSLGQAEDFFFFFFFFSFARAVGRRPSSAAAAAEPMASIHFSGAGIAGVDEVSMGRVGFGFGASTVDIQTMVVDIVLDMDLRCETERS